MFKKNGNGKRNLGQHFNKGEISDCSVSKTEIKGNASGGDKHHDVYLRIGGIAACTYAPGNIKSCTSYDNKIYGSIYHNGIGGAWHTDNKSYAYFTLGGVVGLAHGGTVSSTFYNNNTVTSDRTYYDHNGVDDSKYAICALNLTSGGIGENVIQAVCQENPQLSSAMN